MKAILHHTTLPKKTFEVQITGSKSEQETYQLKSGTLNIEKMSFTLGEVKMMAKGEILNLKNVQNGTPQPFEMEVEILFETIVSAFNPEL